MDPSPLAGIASMTFRLVFLLATVLPFDALDGQAVQSLAAGARVRIDTVGGLGSFTTRISNLRGDTLWVTGERIVLTCNPMCTQQRVREPLRLAPDVIRRLYVSNGGNSRAQSAQKGALVGAGLSLMYVGIIAATDGTSCDDCGGLVAVAGVMFTLVGASVGAILGAVVADERWLPVPWPPKTP